MAIRPCGGVTGTARSVPGWAWGVVSEAGNGRSPSTGSDASNMPVAGSEPGRSGW